MGIVYILIDQYWCRYHQNERTVILTIPFAMWAASSVCWHSFMRWCCNASLKLDWSTGTIQVATSSRKFTYSTGSLWVLQFTWQGSLSGNNAVLLCIALIWCLSKLPSSCSKFSWLYFPCTWLSRDSELQIVNLRAFSSCYGQRCFVLIEPQLSMPSEIYITLVWGYLVACCSCHARHSCLFLYCDLLNGLNSGPPQQY